MLGWVDEFFEMCHGDYECEGFGWREVCVCVGISEAL